MYTREKLCRDQNYETRKSHRNPPSFSATLLDEIYRSIDGNVEEPKIFQAYKEKASRRQGGYEELVSFRRACLVDKWMEKEAKEKAAADNDLIFFSSTSSSSDSSGALSSSDTEFFTSTRGSRHKVSCFTTKPKPAGSKYDDRKKCEDDLIKSKSRALKIYANLKKAKQPISPGGRLTTFINSLFSNANGKKKSRNADTSKGFREVKSPTEASACSSASSFSRSCLSKYSPRSREKMRSGPQRTVRFEPVSVIVDEDLRPCGHKNIYDSSRFGRPPPPPPLAELKLNRKIERVMAESNKRNEVFYDEDDDCFSDSSSDLFELDHLSLYSEELPVYETTHFDTNCAIATRFIR